MNSSGKMPGSKRTPECTGGKLLGAERRAGTGGRSEAHRVTAICDIAPLYRESTPRIRHLTSAFGQQLDGLVYWCSDTISVCFRGH